MSKQSNLTVKGQVTIPKDVRDALGLKPGEPVEFEYRGDGEAVIRKGRRSDAEHQKRYDAALARIAEARRLYRMEPLGMTTDEYMALVREPVPLPDKP